MNPKSAYHPGGGNAELHMALACLMEQQRGRDGSRYLDHIRTRLWKPDGAGIDVNFGWDAIAYERRHATTAGPKCRAPGTPPQVIRLATDIKPNVLPPKMAVGPLRSADAKPAVQ